MQEHRTACDVRQSPAGAAANTLQHGWNSPREKLTASRGLWAPPDCIHREHRGPLCSQQPARICWFSAIVILCSMLCWGPHSNIRLEQRPRLKPCQPSWLRPLPHRCLSPYRQRGGRLFPWEGPAPAQLQQAASAFRHPSICTLEPSPNLYTARHQERVMEEESKVDENRSHHGRMLSATATLARQPWQETSLHHKAALLSAPPASVHSPRARTHTAVSQNTRKAVQQHRAELKAWGLSTTIAQSSTSDFPAASSQPS